MHVLHNESGQQLDCSLHVNKAGTCSTSAPFTMQSVPGSYLLDLPPSLLQQILALCAPAQLARCACTCQQLYNASAESSAWPKHCRVRWAMWASGRWSDMQEQGAWKSLYAARHAVCRRQMYLLDMQQLQNNTSHVADPDGFAYIG